LEDLPAATANELRADLQVNPRDVAAGVVPSRARSAQTYWKIWTNFCGSLHLDPGLSELADPVPLLMVFARRVRDGRLSARGLPVRARSAEDAVRAVGQAFSALGYHDPREGAPGKLDFQLTRQVQGWKRSDSPSSRRQPIPIQVLQKSSSIAQENGGAHESAIADLIWIGFYLLLRPSEYVYTTGTQCLFALQDVYFMINHQCHEATTVPLPLLPLITFAGVTFTHQKNGISGEVIGLAITPNPQSCGARALANRVGHLRVHDAPASTPIYTYFDAQGVSRCIADRYVTAYLRLATTVVGVTIPITVGALRATVPLRYSKATYPWK
jgi:hypothetical protein